MAATHVELTDLTDNANAWTDFHKTLQDLRLNGLFCDVTLLDDHHQSLEAHAVVLASGSAVLKSALSINQSCAMLRKQGLTIKVAGITKQVWQLLLDFLYLRRITVELSMYVLNALYDAARQLGIKALTSSLRTLATNMNLDLDMKGSSAAINITLAPTKSLTTTAQGTQVSSADLADDGRHISTEHTYGNSSADWSPSNKASVKDTAPLPSNKPVACIYCKKECSNKSALIEHLNSDCGGIMKKRAPGRGRKSIKREPGDDEGESKGRGDDDTDYASDDVDVEVANDDYEEDTRIRRQQTKYKKKPRQIGLRGLQADVLPCLNAQCTEVFHSFARQMEHHRTCIMADTSWDIVEYFTEENGLLIYNDSHFEPTGGAIETPSAHHVPNTKKTYTCSHCQYQSARDKMYVHLAVVHGKRRPYHCKLCDARYAYMNSLCDHYSTTHGNLRLQCPQCEETFTNKHNLRRHILSAHKRNNKPIHPCRGCGKLFKLASHARRHESYHLPMEQRRKYVCDLCDKAFLSKQDCFRHRQIHTGERPHKCRKCSYTSLRRFNVVLHERKHGIVHGDWVCINCGRYFISEARFQTHLRVSKHEGTHVSYLNIEADQDEEEFLAAFRAEMANAEYVELGAEEVEGVEGVFADNGQETVKLSTEQLEQLLGQTGNVSLTTGGGDAAFNVSAGNIILTGGGESTSGAGVVTSETAIATTAVVLKSGETAEVMGGVAMEMDQGGVGDGTETVLVQQEMDTEENVAKNELNVAPGSVGVVANADGNVEGQETVYIVQNA